ncbi:hypothetical protein WMO40_20765 [Bacillaceae bacterium CLA-AA-H227]|uniref:Uncharacterized protein n=1 Tax=Robertmurraya yapensis (ex Hitch et al 2024) TaxID=3133160 RepID=A0ACC6SGD9_9BACI|nr:MULTISPECIES: hypothetical protein [Bacillaceae]
MNQNNKIVELKNRAQPVRVRDQQEIFAERRKKRKTKIEEVKQLFKKR